MILKQLKNSKREYSNLIKQRIHQNFPQFSPDYPVRKGKINFIFIHINKTAGTSITKAIKLPKRRHLSAKEVIEIVGKERWEKSYKFTFVRNPWDKVVSHYKYRIKTNQTNLRDNPISFSEWVKLTYGDDKNLFYYDKPKMFQPQNEWLLNDEDKIDIDMIGKFENINKDFQIIADQIGCDSKLPHRNKTEKVDYREFYNDETKAIVAKWFQRDIELFKYEF